MGIKLEKIGADLEKARKKRAEWDAKVKDLERRYREEEILRSMKWFMRPT